MPMTASVTVHVDKDGAMAITQNPTLAPAVQKSKLVLVQSLVMLIITLVLHIKIRQPDHKGIMMFRWEAVSVLR